MKKIIIGMITTIILGGTLIGCNKIVDEKSKDVVNKKIQLNNESDNNISNLNKLTQIAQIGDEYYFARRGMSGLFKGKEKVEKDIKINNDMAICLNAYKDKIYYINQGDSEITSGDIVAISTKNNKDKKTLGRNGTHLLIEEDKLIYINNKGINEGEFAANLTIIDLNTEKEIKNKKLNFAVLDIIDENTFLGMDKDLKRGIYVGNNKIYPDYNSENDIKILGKDRNNIIIQEQAMYADYAGISEIYSVNKNGETIHLFEHDGFKDGYLGSSLVCNGKLYYEKQEELCQFDLKSKKEIKKIGGATENIELFYLNDRVCYGAFNEEEGKLFIEPIYNVKTKKYEKLVEGLQPYNLENK